MKTTTTTLLAALMTLALSCKKETTTIQASGINTESAVQDLLSDNNVTAKITSVKIGSQRWMNKNLDVSRYRNGDRIPQVKDPAKWAALATGAWCWYNNDSANGAVYGRLYNWYAVNDPRGLAPKGWHIPSDAEWDTLSLRLGDYAGGKMKSTGTIEASTGLWHQPNIRGTNKSGFTGLPGGLLRVSYYPDELGFLNLGYSGWWWSSTERDSDIAGNLWLINREESVYRNSNLPKGCGMSVRCLKD